MKFAVRQSMGEKVIEFDGTQESQRTILEMAYSTLPMAFFTLTDWIAWVSNRYGITLDGIPAANALLGLVADLRDEARLEVTVCYEDGAPVWILDQPRKGAK